MQKHCYTPLVEGGQVVILSFGTLFRGATSHILLEYQEWKIMIRFVKNTTKCKYIFLALHHHHLAHGLVPTST